MLQPLLLETTTYIALNVIDVLKPKSPLELPAITEKELCESCMFSQSNSK